MELGVVRLLVAGMLIWVAATASAGEIILTNGDKIKGQLVRLDAKELHWQSDNFGELKIAIDKIAELHDATQVKIDGIEQPCYINGIAKGQLDYRCDDGQQLSGVLPTTHPIWPYRVVNKNEYIHSGKLAVAGTHSRGNKTEENWDVNGETRARRGDYRHVTSLNYESESLNNSGVDEEYEVNYRLDWFFAESWYWYNTVGISADDSRSLDEGYELGSGLGKQVWEDYRGFLALDAGLLYSVERYDPSEEEIGDEDFEQTREEASLRFAVDFSYLLPWQLKFVHNNELLYSLEDSSNWRFYSETGLNVPLRGRLYSEFIVEYDYDNGAQIENRRGDTQFRVGLGYEW